MNAKVLPNALKQVFVLAFQPQAMAGGLAGVTVQQAMRILGCALFAVDLDPLVAEALVQQAGGEIARHALDKAGKPHALIVCGGSKLFHKIVPFIG